MYQLDFCHSFEISKDESQSQKPRNWGLVMFSLRSLIREISIFIKDVAWALRISRWQYEVKETVWPKQNLKIPMHALKPGVRGMLGMDHNPWTPSLLFIVSRPFVEPELGHKNVSHFCFFERNSLLPLSAVSTPFTPPHTKEGKNPMDLHSVAWSTSDQVSWQCSKIKNQTSIPTANGNRSKN